MAGDRRLAIVGCPVLEDEIVYLLSRDRGLADIFVVEDEHSASLVRKMRMKGLSISLLNESDLASLGESDGRSVLIWMKSMGLHEEPKELGKEVARTARVLDGHCATILLFYGLCGNAFKDMNVLFEGVQTPVVILTDDQGRIVDDCIAVPLGGTDGYLKLLRRYAGVFYLTPAWADNWKLLINKMEMARGTEYGDLEMLRMLFEMAGYNRMLLIDTGLGCDEGWRDRAREFGQEFKFRELELEPEFVSTKVSEDAYRKCLDLVENGKR